MPYVMKRIRPMDQKAYFAGLGGGEGRAFSSPKWVTGQFPPEEAEVFDTEKDVIEHAKIIFPQLVARRQIHAERLEEK